MAAAVGPIPGPQYYFNYFKSRRDTSSKGELKCLYCEYKKARKDKSHVYVHVTQDHPDFPLLLYDCEIPDEPVQFDSKEIPAALRDIQNRREERMKDRAKDKTYASPAIPPTPETPLDPFRSPQPLDPRLSRHRRDSTSSFVSIASANSSPQILEQDIPPPVDVLEVSESLRDLIPPSNEQSSTVGSASIKHPHSNVVTFPGPSSTSTAVKPTRKKSVEEDDGFAEPIRKRNPGYRPEKDNQVYEAEAVRKSRMLKCLMVKNGVTCGQTFLESKKEVHLKTVHEITSGFGCHCGGDQWWYGTKGNVKHHIKLQHNNSGTIYTCIVSENQDKPTLLEKINPKADPFNVADHSKLDKPLIDGSRKKGSLTKKIEGSQYLGPLRNEKSNKPMPGQQPSTIGPVSKKPSKQEVKKWRVEERIDEKRVIKNVLHSINNSSTTSVIFCLFCDKTFDVEEDAIDCMKHHLEYGLHCDHCGSYVRDNRDAIHHYKAHHSDHDGVAFVKDDEKYKPGIQHWICDFFNYQTAIFNKTFREKSSKPANPNVYVECPLCIKALTTLNSDGVAVVKYYDFLDFERHFNEHSKYSKYQCTQCTLRVKESKFGDHLKKHKITDTNNPKKYFNVRRETVDKLLEQIIDGKRREFEEKRKKYLEEKDHESSSSSDDDEDPKATKPTEPKATESKATKPTEPKATEPIESTSKKDEEKKKPIAFNPPPPKPVELDDDIVFEDEDHGPEPKKRCTARKQGGPKTTFINPKAGSPGGSESDDDIQVVWYSTGDVFVALQRDKQLDRRALLESEKGNSTVKSTIVPKVEPATDAEQTVASSSASIQDATNVREISPADIEAFRKTLNERLPLGCKYCCKPEARFLKRVDIKSHISQCHPNQAIQFLTWIGKS